jgi:membrane protein
MALNEGIEPQSSGEAVSQNPWWQRGVAGIVRSAYRSWFDHRTVRFGAGLAYYALYAAVPLVAVSLFVASLIFGNQDVGQYLTTQLEQVVGPDAAGEVTNLLNGLQRDVSNGLTGIVLIIATVVAASLVYVALEDGMGIVWEAPRRHGLEAGLRRKLLAIGLVLLGAAALAAGLIASVILGGVSDALSNRELIDDAANIVASLLSAVILAVLVLTIFKYIPSVPVGWSSAIISSMITTAALLIGTQLAVVYLNHFSDASVAGVTSALLGLLAWLYLEAQILLAGAELNRAIEQRDTPVGVDADGQRPHGAGPPHPQNAD